MKQRISNFINRGRNFVTRELEELYDIPLVEGSERSAFLEKLLDNSNFVWRGFQVISSVSLD